MSKDLVIVESPTKARTITRILSSGYRVTASNGHVRDLPERTLGIAIDKGFQPAYQVTKSRTKVIQELKAAVKDAKQVYLATDPDREGEAIAWHIYELLKGENRAASFHRVTFHEITRTAVQEAFGHPGQLDMARVNAQQARRVLDRIVGYQVSPLLWKQVEKGTSAGRVQSVALRLIVEREREIGSFVPEEYWNLVAHFQATSGGMMFPARLAEVDGRKAVVTSAEQATALADDAERGRYAVSKVTRQPRERRAPPPFITSTLQQAASANLRFNPQTTMSLAQQLYEGVDTGNGPSGLITYMRTDSVNVAKEAQAAALSFIGEAFGPDYVPAKANLYRSKGNAQEAHEAIRPTDVRLTPEKAAKYLDDRQAKLYRLIWNRFMASQMAPARELRYTIELSNAANSGAVHAYLFRATSTQIVFPGFLKVYNLQDVESDEEKEAPLPDLPEGQACRLDHLDREQKFTEPPPRYSEATLVRELEKNGIGRPSTYASIVNTIQERKYVGKEKGKLIPTKLGYSVNDFLIGRIPKLFDVDFTATMENQLDQIEEGSLEWVRMLEQFYASFQGWVGGATPNGPGDERARQVLALFPAELPWEAPTGRGKRVYDDRKFFTSLQEQLDGGKSLSARQWQALLQLAVKYQAHLPGLATAPLDDETRQQLATLQQARQEQEAIQPAPETLRLLDALGGVQKWEEAVTKGKKTYDDSAFFRSLKEQSEQGRALSQAQVKALSRLAVKYREQIPDYAALASSASLPEAPAAAEISRDRLDAVFALVDEIKTYEPARSRGRRVFDDREFLDSLRRQHQQGRSFSSRQWEALQKVVAKYAAQIADFERRGQALGLQAGAPKAAPEPTGVKCPQCGEGELRKRTGRRGAFYGCSRYPACKYLTESLTQMKPPKAAAAGANP